MYIKVQLPCETWRFASAGLEQGMAFLDVAVNQWLAGAGKVLRADSFAGGDESGGRCSSTLLKKRHCSA